MNWCILIPAIAGLICAILGYLLGRLLGSSANKKEIEDCVQRNTKLEADLKASQSKLPVLESDLKTNQGKLSMLESDLKISQSKLPKLEADLKECQSKLSLASSSNNTTIPSPPNPSATSSFAASTANISSSTADFDADGAKAIFGKKIKQDDLKLVEGIGPKIEELFYNHDVKTWKALSECSVDKCQNVLNSGGSRYKMHNPRTWPEQAKFAHEGKWQELLDWQNKLDGGR